MSFATVVARPRLVGGFLGPLEDRQLLAVAADDDPAHGVVALSAADFTSIDGANHKMTSRKGLRDVGTRVTAFEAALSPDF